MARSARVAQAACDLETSGSDHAVDDEDGSDTEGSVRCDFLESMAAESFILVIPALALAIALAGRADSLNLAIATAVTAYEIWRQKSFRGARD